MAIQNEVWAQDIQKILFQTDLDFLNLATSHDSYAVGPDGKGYKRVHLPQAGAFGSGISTNYSGSYPRVVSQRTDTEFDYPIDEYTTDPIIYTYAEELQVSYPKRETIIRQQVELMAQKVGSEVLYKWGQNSLSATSSNGASCIVRTSGATSSLYNEGAQTGSRKLITLSDLISLGLVLDRQFVPKNDRYLMLPSTLYYQMFEIPQFNNAINLYGFSKDKNTLVGGELPEVMGFKILHRPVVSAYYGSTATGGVIGNEIPPDSTGLLSTLDAAGNLAGIAFQRDMVAKAYGGVQAFQGIQNNPIYNGGQDLMALVMLGATRLRTDNKGVVMLVQTT